MRHLGRTGVEVSELCLGTWMFGTRGNKDHDECEKMINRALDAGLNFIDTADSYSNGEAEEIVGRAIKNRRDEVVLTTKFFNPMGPGPNRRGGSRRWIVRAVEESLRRLQTEWIDIYQMHRPDPSTDIDETLGALSDLVRQGKIRYLGSSMFPAEQIVEARWVSESRGHHRFLCEEPQYSILTRGAERAVLPTCQKYGIGVMVWSPLAGGWLTGKYRKGAPVPAGSRAEWSAWIDPTDERKLGVVERLVELAAGIGRPLAHVALAWALNHPAVTSTIIGPRTPQQLEELLGAEELRLDSDVLDAIDAIVPPGVDVDPSATGFEPWGLARTARRR